MEQLTVLGSAVRKRRWAYGFLSFVLLAVVFFLTKSASSHTNAQKHFLEAFLRGDGHALYAFTFDEERKAYDLTPEKLQRVIDEFVRPRLSRFHPVGPVEAVLVAGATTPQVFQMLEDDQGHRLEFSVSPVRTPEGAKERLEALLTRAWYAEYVVGKGLAASRENRLRGQIEGIRHDRKRLEELGIGGFSTALGDDPNDLTLRDWDQTLASLESRLP